MLTKNTLNPLSLKQFVIVIAGALLAVCIPLIGTIQSASAASVDTYCGQYQEASKKYACKDGWTGVDCSDYLITHDQEHVTICQNAGREAEKSGVSEDNTSNPNTGNNNGGGSNTPAPGSSTSSDKDNQDSIDQILQLIKKIQDTQNNDSKSTTCTIKDGKTTCTTTCTSTNNGNPLSLTNLATGTFDACTSNQQADNTYGQYINGAGNKQAIRVSKASGSKDSGNPAIIFINGGGWHTDDRTGDRAAPLANQRGYTTFVATYRLGSSGIYYMYEDVMRAINHVRSNASMYGIDPSKIAIWGDSAGASLALRAAASGKSGLAGAVGWSAPTNAYTAIFKSVEAFAIGMDHSSCAPTDLAGVMNIIDTLNGAPGSETGDTIPYDGGILNNGGESSRSLSSSLSTVTSVLTFIQNSSKNSINPSEAAKTGTDPETGATTSDATRGAASTLNNTLLNLSSQKVSAQAVDENSSTTTDTPTDNTKDEDKSGETEKDSESTDNTTETNDDGISGGGGGGGGGGEDQTKNLRNLTTKKLIQCISNFNDASPALFASPLTPPTFLAGFRYDPIVDPGQLYQMRDKLRSMGVASSALVLPGKAAPNIIPGKNHLGYNKSFVKPTLDFLDKHVKKEEAKKDKK
ncbi:MAG: alpha/beta hydrolase [Candidatus Saccharimonadales bacterium]